MAAPGTTPCKPSGRHAAYAEWIRASQPGPKTPRFHGRKKFTVQNTARIHEYHFGQDHSGHRRWRQAAWRGQDRAQSRRIRGDAPMLRKPSWIRVRIPPGNAVAQTQGQAAREPAGDGLRGSVVPEHSRMLRQGHGDVHDPRRRVHATLLVLRRRARPAQAARSADEPRASGRNDPRHGSALCRDHFGRPRRSSRRRRRAFRRLHPRRALRESEHPHRNPDAGFPRQGPHGARTRSAGQAPPDVFNHNLETVRAAVSRSAPGRRLRLVAGPPRTLQGAASGYSDQVRHHARTGRNVRPGRGSVERFAFPRGRYGYDRPVSAAHAAPPSGLPLLDAGRVRRAGRNGLRAWVSSTSPRGRWCARRITPTRWRMRRDSWMSRDFRAYAVL